MLSIDKTKAVPNSRDTALHYTGIPGSWPAFLVFKRLAGDRSVPFCFQNAKCFRICNDVTEASAHHLLIYGTVVKGVQLIVANAEVFLSHLWGKNICLFLIFTNFLHLMRSRNGIWNNCKCGVKAMRSRIYVSRMFQSIAGSSWTWAKWSSRNLLHWRRTRHMTHKAYRFNIFGFDVPTINWTSMEDQIMLNLFLLLPIPFRYTHLIFTRNGRRRLVGFHIKSLLQLCSVEIAIPYFASCWSYSGNLSSWNLAAEIYGARPGFTVFTMNRWDPILLF